MPSTRASSSRSNLRLRYVVAAIAALVTLQVFAILVTGVSAQDSSITAAREGITREGRTTAQSILRHLEPAEQSVEVTARLLEADLIDTSDPGLEQYLFTQLAVMPQMTGAFVGYPNGDFVFVAVDGDGYRTKRIDAGPDRLVQVDRYDSFFGLASTEMVFDDEYDPRVRPWFESAASSDETIWTDPYVFFSSQQPGVTASRAVRVDGEVVAVVGVDVELSGLAAFLDDLNVSDQGEAFVISGDLVLGAPTSYQERIGVDENGDLRLLTAAELGVPQFGEGSRSEVRRVSTDDGTDLVLHSDFPDERGVDWSVVVRAPERSFTATSDAQQRTMLLLTLGGGLLVLVGGLVLARVTRPIQQVQDWASTDSLTGLANRRRIDHRGDEMLSDLEGDEMLAVLVLDLDGFKDLNDMHGHSTGDRALQEVGRLLAGRFGPNDLIGRFGGDEFVLARRVRSLDLAIGIANSVMDEVRALLLSTFPNSDVGVSAGLSAGASGDVDFQLLLMEADAALIVAKSESKGMLRVAERLVKSSI